MWAVTRGQITLSALKTRLRTCFAFPDGTEDEHIVIIRESGKEHVRLVDDEDLACIIWTQGFKVDLPIIVDTCRYGGDFFMKFTQQILTDLIFVFLQHNNHSRRGRFLKSSHCLG